MLVIVSLATLAADSGGVAYLDDGVAITGDAARRLACDAGVSRPRATPLGLAGRHPGQRGQFGPDDGAGPIGADERWAS